MTRTTYIGILLAMVLGATGVAEAKTTPAEKCVAAKLQAASKKASGELACYAKAVKKGIAIDPACIAKVETKFTEAFAKAELRAKNDCPVLGEAASVEDVVDTFVTSTAQIEHVCLTKNQMCEIGPCCPGSTCVLDTGFGFRFCR